MQRRALIIGTAGHIDHGKTTLVQALTGVDTDRLKEEQQRGITIELGFAPLELADVHVGFVDVPGHEKFVKHMLAGAGGIDAVLLVVAADASVMPQTREHVEICSLLQIPRAVLAITKTDIADPETIELVELESLELLEEHGFTDVPVVQVSGRTGEGVEELKAVLQQLGGRLEARTTEMIPRLPVDRVFSIKGHGTIITGTLVSGSLRSGDDIVLLPSGVESPVKGLQVHGESVQTATAGHRVAVNVPALAVDEIARGDVLALKGTMLTSGILDLSISMLPDAPGPLEHNQRVRFHIGSAELLGRIDLLGSSEIPPGSEDVARIRLESPAAALSGDRFVIRRYSPMITIGGGTILDNAPPDMREKKADIRLRLMRWSRLESDAILESWIADAKEPVSVSEISARFGYHARKAAELLASLTEQGNALFLTENPATIIGRKRLQQVVHSIKNQLKDLHVKRPLVESFQTDSLKTGRNRTVPDLLFRAAVAQGVEEGLFRLSEGSIALEEHSVELDEQQKQTLITLEKQFDTFSPPDPRQAVADTGHRDGQALLDLLIARGTIIRIASGYFMHIQARQRLLDELKTRAGSQPFSVTAFKDWFNLTRKHAIPLLEYLDSKGITHREGDTRRLL